LTIFATNSSGTISNVRLTDADIYRVVVCQTPLVGGLFIATALRDRLLFSGADGCVPAIWLKHGLAAGRSGLLQMLCNLFKNRWFHHFFD